MIFYSTYFKGKLFLRVIKFWQWPILILFIGAILFVSGSHNPYPVNFGGRKKSIVEIVIDSITGLPYYGITQFVISIIIFLLLGLMCFSYLYTEHKKMKMIVGLEFNKSNDQLILFTKDLLDRKRVITVKLSKVRLKEELCKDRVGTKKFNCLVFISNNLAIGRLYVDHFTWNNYQEIDSIKSYINSRMI